jgi:hypothetical protein
VIDNRFRAVAPSLAFLQRFNQLHPCWKVFKWVIRCAPRGWLPLMTLLLVAVAARPIGAQPAASPIDVMVDGGVLGAGPAAWHRVEGAPAHVTWFGGLTARTARVPLGRGWNFSAAAALRREPAFALARSAATVTPAYFDALTASTAIHFSHISGRFETAAVGRFAETRLDRAQRLTRAANTIDDWAFLVDAVLDVRWYRRRDAPSLVPDRSRSPIVSAFVGVQHNQRLHRAGDLQGFDDPTGRVVGGIDVTPWQLRNIRGERVMTVGGAMDVEAAIRGGERLPAGLRLSLRVELDLRRAGRAWRHD